MKKTLILALIMIAVTAWARAQGTPSRVIRLKIATLQSQVAAKEEALERAWVRLQRLNRRQAELTSEALELPRRNAEEGEVLKQVDGLLTASYELESIADERREVLRDIKELYEEILFLQGEIRDQRREDTGYTLMEGHWALTIMPEGLRGDVYLQQDGTMISGEYRFENSLTGNLEGTFINTQLVVERIDSRYGKMGRFEGELSQDRNMVRGTWYSYDMMSGKPMVGPFTLVRENKEESP